MMNGGSENPIFLSDDSEVADMPMGNEDFFDLSRDNNDKDEVEVFGSSSDHPPTLKSSSSTHPTFAGPPMEGCKREFDDDEIDINSALPSKKLRQEEIITDGTMEEKITHNSLLESESSAKEGATSTQSNIAEATTTSRPPTDTAVNNTRDSVMESNTYSSLDCDPEYVSTLDLSEIPSDVGHLPLLTTRELAELELALQIEKSLNEEGWPSDWNGTLDMMYADILLDKDRISENPHGKRKTMEFFDWVTKNSKDKDDFRGIRLLFSFVYHMDGTPPMAKKIIAYSLERPVNTIDERRKCIDEAVRRISYDPIVLAQDGWTTRKADSPEGPSGGAYYIGRKIWKKYEAIIIAYVKDDERDLWKAIWIEENDTFDLEADELQEGLKAWGKKASKVRKTQDTTHSSSSSSIATATGQLRPKKASNYEASLNFSVEGAEYGIILATPPHDTSPKSSRIRWPARILHMKELKSSTSQSNARRNSSKSTVQIIFLAPYWNAHKTASKGKENLNGHHEPEAVRNDAFSSGVHFENATVEASEDVIFPYPYDCRNGVLSIDKLRAAFSFTRLPNSAFPRYLDSHRLAMALRQYAYLHLRKSSAITSLTDFHPMSIRAPEFPSVVLNLPYDFILAQLPHPSDLASRPPNEDENELTEHVLNIKFILESMSPPLCWNPEEKGNNHEINTNSIMSPLESPRLQRRISGLASVTLSTESCLDISQYTRDIFFLNLLEDDSCRNSELRIIGDHLEYLLTQLNQFSHHTFGLKTRENIEKLGSFLLKCLDVKAFGEDFLLGVLRADDKSAVQYEWRKICERIYRTAKRYAVENETTSVITDSRCNQHITANTSIERAVRLPAAIVGAKRAGAGSSNAGIQLITKVEDEFISLAEKKIIPMAHKGPYIKRLKDKISALNSDAKGVPLTDDSSEDTDDDEEKTKDTVGSRGSYTAAVAAVAAALKGVTMVVGANCVNAFCAVRPPGHHAGRDLHPMKAVSNGFCLLNAVACAALYAVTPKSDGGLGLKRVCVIDFDVHHGNGTQDILCSTYDSRFLYVSTHAGGASINGFDEDDSPNEYLGSLSRRRKIDGIFPGRCGDFSPHDGVLNLPLGKQVTAEAFGLALTSQIYPAVEKFAPDLILLSAGFDAHKNDPLGMGSLSADDFGLITNELCSLARRVCSGRLMSILEGGYGVPCCRPPLRKNLFLPDQTDTINNQFMDLGEELPDDMEDNLDADLIKKTANCHQEGFLDCVKEHVASLRESACELGKKSVE